MIEEEAENQVSQRVKFVRPKTAPAVASLASAVGREKARRDAEKKARREAAVERMTPGAREVYRFREFLIRRFGNLVRGWVLVFDRDKSGTVSRKEFFTALNELQYKGDAP